MASPIHFEFHGLRYSTRQLARAVGCCSHSITAWRRNGFLSEAWLDAFVEERKLVAARRSVGLSDHVVATRLRLEWDLVAANTTPKLVSWSRRRGARAR